MIDEARKARIAKVIEDAERRSAQCKGPCASCRWIKRSEWSKGDQCHQPIVMLEGLDPRTGPQPKAAYAQREAYGLCGPEGVLREPRGLRVVLPRYRKHDFAKAFNTMGLALATLATLITGANLL